RKRDVLKLLRLLLALVGLAFLGFVGFLRLLRGLLVGFRLLGLVGLLRVFRSLLVGSGFLFRFRLFGRRLVARVRGRRSTGLFGEQRVKRGGRLKIRFNVWVGFQMSLVIPALRDCCFWFVGHNYGVGLPHFDSSSKSGYDSETGPATGCS